MQLQGICPRPSSTTPSFHHHHLHGEGHHHHHHQQVLPFTIITFTEKVPHWGGLGLLPDLPREEGVEKSTKPPKGGQNFSWHLYYMLKMQFPLKLNRIPGGPIPFSLLEILPFLPQGLPRLPSPGSTLIELKNRKNINLSPLPLNSFLQGCFSLSQSFHFLFHLSKDEMWTLTT